jgi:MFS family permease
MAGCVVLSIGAALQCSAYSIPHLIVGRIIAGIGNGLNTSTIREPSLEFIFLSLFAFTMLTLPQRSGILS